MSEGAERIDVSGHSSFALEKDEVVLVSGGAKGITSELVLGLARKTGAKLALLGSSPLPLQGTDDQAAEILDNLERYRKEGIPFRYYQCDVTDLISVQRTVKGIEKELGPIAAIFHGAGISQLKLFRDMDVDSFLKVIRVKVRGLYNLLVTVDAVHLRALHVISSVLGRTGMKGQADYTLANAWLESAVKSFKSAFPHVHCLSLGYSVWAEAGLGKKLGVVDMLSSFGITPISTREGVDAYLELLRNSPDAHSFVITGRMSPQLEANLFVPPVHLEGRFLERIVRWIPGGEIVAEATVSHATDLYLAEHVFEGTPVFPAVMAVDAMVQAAAACTGKTELPILRNVGFHRPLIVPESAAVVLRTIAVVDSTEENMTRVKVIMRSDEDRFRENHFEAECLFVKDPFSGSMMPACPVLGKKLSLNPEDFNPDPLFQGKFFRRISGVYKIDEFKESITEVTVPMGERYFRNTNGALAVLTSPAVRDAFLQSGALLLPFGYLPVSIEEIRFSRKITPGTRIICHCTGSALHDNSFIADIAVFSQDGELLETLRGIHLIAPKMKERVRRERMSSPVAVTRIEDDIRTLLPEFPVAVAVIEHASLDTLREISEIAEKDRQRIGEKHAPPRQASATANLAATRRAAVAYAQRYLNINMSPHRISLTSHQDGKPELHFDEVALSEEFRGIDVSLTDGFGMFIAVVGPAPVGIDIEQVESRDAELWYGLLGEDGYNLSRRLAESSEESFDKAATRVWTILESGKKVNGLNRIVPNLQENLNGNWLSLSTAPGGSLLFLSALLATGSGPKNVAALTVVLSRKAKPGTQQPAAPEDTRGVPPEANSRTPEKIRSLRVASREEQEFEHVMDGFLSFLQKAKVEFQNDPDSRNLERHYQQYSTLIIETTEALRRIQDSLPSGSVYQKQRRMYDAVRPFCEGSVIFRRALDKPLGYPGDFLLLDMMFSSVPSSRGLGYHFDRYFLTYAGTEAVRQRSYWVISRVLDMFSQRKTKAISLLDLGCGPMTIEKILLEQMPPDGRLTLTGFDFDGAALEYARARLEDPRITVAASQKNLVSPEGISEIRQAAAQADVCICMGLIEYVSDESATAVFEALFEGSRPGTRILTSNYRPGHYAQTAMEWFIDWWLMYRTEEDLMRILRNSGFDEHHMKTSRDSTNSIVFLDVQR
ncbi:MAG: SDR family NAD(P)-dependent oxidoreductase [bacterium]